jgi:hypothetical protein
MRGNLWLSEIMGFALVCAILILVLLWMLEAA